MAYGNEVSIVRYFRTIKLNSGGSVVIGGDGKAEKWTDEQVAGWWNATSDDDFKVCCLTPIVPYYKS